MARKLAGFKLSIVKSYNKEINGLIEYAIIYRGGSIGIGRCVKGSSKYNVFSGDFLGR